MRLRSTVVSDEEDLWIGRVLHVVNGSPGLLTHCPHTHDAIDAIPGAGCSAVRSCRGRWPSAGPSLEIAGLMVSLVWLHSFMFYYEMSFIMLISQFEFG